MQETTKATKNRANHVFILNVKLPQRHTYTLSNTELNITGLQIIVQKLSEMMSVKNKILLGICENLLDINIYKCF